MDLLEINARVYSLAVELPDNAFDVGRAVVGSQGDPSGWIHGDGTAGNRSRTKQKYTNDSGMMWKSLWKNVRVSRNISLKRNTAMPYFKYKRATVLNACLLEYCGVSGL